MEFEFIGKFSTTNLFYECLSLLQLEINCVERGPISIKSLRIHLNEKDLYKN